jgi:hypothetical protein
MARYPFPWDLFFVLARDLPAGRRSLVEDCTTMVTRIWPAPVVSGVEHVPSDGPVAVAANHYQRRGLWIAWPGAVITWAVAQRRGPSPPLHWLVTGGLRWFQWADRGAEVPCTRSLLRAVARTYDMASLPLSGPRERAAALRDWIRRAEKGGAIGIFPEGLAGGSHGLRQPQPGFDALCRVLIAKSIPVLPVGIFEQQDALQVRFGACSQLHLHCGDGDRVMERIAALLPADRRGVYSRVEDPTAEMGEGPHHGVGIGTGLVPREDARGVAAREGIGIPRERG